MKQLTQQELNALKPGESVIRVTLEGTIRLQLICEHPDTSAVQVFQHTHHNDRVTERFKHEYEGGWFGGEYDPRVSLEYQAKLHEDKAKAIRANLEKMEKGLL